MIPEKMFAEYFEGRLSGPERAQVEQWLKQHPEDVEMLLDQRTMEHGLRLLLGSSESVERLRESIVAVIQGPPMEQLRQRVLETVGEMNGRTRSRNRERRAWLALAATVLICGGVLNQIYRYAHRDVVHQVILSSSRPPEIIEIPTGNLSPETTIRAVAATPGPAVMLWNQPLPAGTRLAEPSVRVSSTKNFVAKPAKEQEAAGLVQPSEWTYGLAHALAVGINPRWRPEFKMGDRLALPENFDPTALGWKEDAPAALLARALRSYGAYVVELTTMETGALFTAGSPPPDLDAEELTKLFEHLARVETSSSSEAAPRFLSPAQR